ncbi:Tryptophan--tRNA ligase [Durusdinium trenchii]|uniref:tryptophan--tRNA ligase n=1 Tax=Durusdinium trenchii TaxID=1381693 RepID=A0ABP0J8Q1_9DINO
MSFEGTSREPFPKEDAHNALLIALEAETNRLAAGGRIAVFEMDKADAEKKYGEDIYEPKSQRPDRLRVAGMQLLFGTETDCGKIEFLAREVEAGSKKKPDTMIMAKKKQVFVKFSVGNPDAPAADIGGEMPSEDPWLPQDEAKALTDKSVRVEVLGVDVKDEAKEELQTAEGEMVVDPWSVKGKIDYEKLIRDFGSTKISDDLLERIRKITVGSGRVSDLHCWLRRNIFFSHRELDAICALQEKGKPFYLYTGRGPSSAAMHLGHLLPFMFTQWLQKAFDVPLVIQMTDDEKFLWKGEYDPEKGDNLHVYKRFTIENAKDIIACGFDKKKTFIFSDLEYVGHMYPNIVRVWKAITYNTARGAFGFVGESNIGQSAFPAVQAVPSFPSSFNVPFKGDQHLPCLIPCAIDQDPYFRVTRDIAHKLVPKDHPLKGKPSLIHCKFFPPLTGAEGKMAASDENSAIFLTDTPEDIEKKITKYAFSGVEARSLFRPLFDAKNVVNHAALAFHGLRGVHGAGCAHGVRLLADPRVFRMLLQYKEAKYVDKQYTRGEDWFKSRKPDILAMNPLANLPYLVDGETCICQTNAILSYLGDKFGLNGTTEAQKIRTQELLAEIYDVRNGMIDMVYPFKNVCRNKEEFDAKAAQVAGSPPFAKFEAILSFKGNASGGKWFVLADGPGVADFHIWEMLDQHKMLAERIGAPDIFEKFPKCKAFYEAFKALPTLQKYFASDDYKMDVMPTPKEQQGGRQTAKEQREKGADLDADVSYQWLRFFLDDDAELQKIEEPAACIMFATVPKVLQAWTNLDLCPT